MQYNYNCEAILYAKVSANINRCIKDCIGNLLVSWVLPSHEPIW